MCSHFDMQANKLDTGLAWNYPGLSKSGYFNEESRNPHTAYHDSSFSRPKHSCCNPTSSRSEVHEPLVIISVTCIQRRRIYTTITISINKILTGVTGNLLSCSSKNKCVLQANLVGNHASERASKNHHAAKNCVCCPIITSKYMYTQESLRGFQNLT